MTCTRSSSEINSDKPSPVNLSLLPHSASFHRTAFFSPFRGRMLPVVWFPVGGGAEIAPAPTIAASRATEGRRRFRRCTLRHHRRRHCCRRCRGTGLLIRDVVCREGPAAAVSLPATPGPPEIAIKQVAVGAEETRRRDGRRQLDGPTETCQVAAATGGLGSTGGVSVKNDMWQDAITSKYRPDSKISWNDGRCPIVQGREYVGIT